MEIKQLDDSYKGYTFEVSYVTNHYYDIEVSMKGFKFEIESFKEPTTKGFKDEIMSEWLENPIAYGAFDNEELVGFVEGFYEEWNNRYRISNIVIFKEQYRHQGLGEELLTIILEEAKKSGARMAVLETQSCNEHAIHFYIKHGFRFIGLDTYAYSNEDLENHEVRMELGKKL